MSKQQRILDDERRLREALTKIVQPHILSGYEGQALALTSLCNLLGDVLVGIGQGRPAALERGKAIAVKALEERVAEGVKNYGAFVRRFHQ